MKKKKNKNERPNDEVQSLKQEIDRFNQLYLASKEECNGLKKELTSLQVKKLSHFVYIFIMFSNTCESTLYTFPIQKRFSIFQSRIKKNC